MKSSMELMKKTSTILASNNRCPSCSRKYLLKSGQEYCFHCDVIAKEDSVIEDEVKAMMKRREKEERFAVFQEKSLINTKLARATFDNYVPQNGSQHKALERCRRYVDEFPTDMGLWFHGKPGLGKSHLSAAIAKGIIEKEKTCVFISLPRLMTEIKSTYNKQSEHTELEIFKGLETVDLLILDDLGAEKTREDNTLSWSKTKVFEIVDSRIGKPTIFTTNFTSRELIAMYGERDFSRMVENIDVIKLVGENFRLKGFK